MDTEPTDAFYDDTDEPEAAKELDNAMANIVRAIHAFHKWGVPQDLVLRLVERRSNFQWQADVDEVPMLSQLIGDPAADKIPGTSAKARASQTRASKFKGKLNRINTDPKARAIMWPPDAPDAPDVPDAPRSYFDLMFDALLCIMKAMKARREQATGNVPTAAPTDAAAPNATEVPLGWCQLPFGPLPFGSTDNSPTAAPTDAAGGGVVTATEVTLGSLPRLK